MKVKRILLAAIFLTIYLKGGAQPQLTASAVMEKAFATARKENKKVFLIFHQLIQTHASARIPQPHQKVKYFTQKPIKNTTEWLKPIKTLYIEFYAFLI